VAYKVASQTGTGRRTISVNVTDQLSLTSSPASQTVTIRPRLLSVPVDTPAYYRANPLLPLFAPLEVQSAINLKQMVFTIQGGYHVNDELALSGPKADSVSVSGVAGGSSFVFTISANDQVLGASYADMRSTARAVAFQSNSTTYGVRTVGVTVTSIDDQTNSETVTRLVELQDAGQPQLSAVSETWLDYELSSVLSPLLQVFVAPALQLAHPLNLFNATITIAGNHSQSFDLLQLSTDLPLPSNLTQSAWDPVNGRLVFTANDPAVGVSVETMQTVLRNIEFSTTNRAGSHVLRVVTFEVCSNRDVAAYCSVVNFAGSTRVINVYPPAPAVLGGIESPALTFTPGNAD